MRLTLKITLVTFAGVLLVVAGYSYLTVRRQIAEFDRDNRANHQVLGRTLAAAVATAWQSGGESAAIALLASADAEQSKVHLRWVAVDGSEPDYEPPFEIPPEVLAALARGATVSFEPPGTQPGQRLYTYVPIPLAAPLTGAVEISESLDDQRQFTRETILQAVGITALLACVCAAVALALGSWLVARPVRFLTAMTDRIARGDLTARVRLRQRDELATLAEALNDMAAQLEAALAELRHADRLSTVGKLASGMAHELGTPLNVIAGSAHMIAAQELASDELVEAARTIEEQAHGMSGIIRQLLDFARRRAPEKTALDLGEVVERTLEMLRPLAEKRGVQLLLERGTDTVAEIDRGQMAQAVTNLVMNAIQAMDRGGRVEVRVDSAVEEPPADIGGGARRFVRAAVRDAGPGMDPEVLSHVFEPFFTTKRVGEGTGLGLSVSYGLVREHGGWIAVESTRDRGSMFTIHVPGA